MNTNDEHLRELKGIFLNDQEDTLRTLRTWKAQRTGCVSIPRGHDLAFEPSAATAEERVHLAGCAHCQRLLAKFRAIAHPALAVLYAATRQKLAAEDLTLVQEHLTSCVRCRLVTTVSDLIPPSWTERAFAVRRMAFEATVSHPAAVGLHLAESERIGFSDIVENGECTVELAGADGDLRIVINRCDDGEPHHAVKVVVMGRGEVLAVNVSLRRRSGWWTGSEQVENPWVREVDELDLSVVVLDVE